MLGYEAKLSSVKAELERAEQEIQIKSKQIHLESSTERELETKLVRLEDAVKLVIDSPLHAEKHSSSLFSVEGREYQATRSTA